ncbi:type II toxin-antitoxin system RelE/ParE family toxin [Streptomyces sp. NPDC051561]|uniref:type II toxin-antitoxin system RelE/ParE family toxin n=1 Tax=Streptomyces sp. NPDC051561 TaxID=3365658 RepID=UPI0037B4D111
MDPRALEDLLEAPRDVCDLALAQLQEVINGELRGGKLLGDLSGYRKLYVDYRAAWRIVYGLRPADSRSTHATEVHVVAIRPRDQGEVYDRAAARIGRPRRSVSALAHAARARSPQATVSRPSPLSLPAVRPGLPAPAPLSLPTSGRTR